MKTLDDVASYMSLFERYHPEYTEEELKQLTVSLISTLPENEKKKFLTEYYAYCDKHYESQDLDEYTLLYSETNEGS